MTVILVTGSRSLRLRHGAAEWCTKHICEAITSYTDVVVTGDAAGPDSWAWDAALDDGVKCRRWSLDGFIYGNRDEPPVRWAPADYDSLSPQRRPLARNAAMVRSVAHHHPNAIVLAFKDPDSRTDGTGHTGGSRSRPGSWCLMRMCAFGVLLLPRATAREGGCSGGRPIELVPRKPDVAS